MDKRGELFNGKRNREGGGMNVGETNDKLQERKGKLFNWKGNRGGGGETGR